MCLRMSLQRVVGRPVKRSACVFVHVYRLQPCCLPRVSGTHKPIDTVQGRPFVVVYQQNVHLRTCKARGCEEHWQSISRTSSQEALSSSLPKQATSTSSPCGCAIWPNVPCKSGICTMSNTEVQSEPRKSRTSHRGNNHDQFTAGPSRRVVDAVKSLSGSIFHIFKSAAPSFMLQEVLLPKCVHMQGHTTRAVAQ